MASVIMPWDPHNSNSNYSSGFTQFASGSYYPVGSSYSTYFCPYPYSNIIATGMGGAGIAGAGIHGGVTSGTISIHTGSTPTVAPKPEIKVVDYQTRKREKFFEFVNAGHFKQVNEPRYDTLKLWPGELLTEQVAFCYPRGQCSKTGADTNMDIGSQLGMPYHALWDYIHIHFERYTGIEDAIRWKENTQIELITGYNDITWQGTLGSMKPILPKGGYNKIDEKIKTGVIRFWPWYEAELDSITIDPVDMFQVRFRYKVPMKVERPMSIKVVLGPYLYRLG